MAIFGVEVSEDNDKLRSYIEQFELRGRDKNYLKNPFTIKTFQKKNLLAVYIEPIYFNFSYIGLVSSSIIFFIWRRWWGMLMIATFLLFSLFWNGCFYYMVFYFGLRKNGYKGKIKYLSKKKVLEKMVFEL